MKNASPIVLDTWPPQLASLAARLQQVSAEDAVDLIWTDQRQRWLAGERIPAEAYLACGQAILSASGRVDVVYAEVLLHRELGLPLALEESQRRFPDLAGQLSQQWSFDSLFQSCFDDLPADNALVQTRLESSTSIEQKSASQRAQIASAAEPAAIGKYKVIARLGSGGQAQVFRAWHPTLQRDVVIKLAHRPTPPGQRSLVVEEGRILAQVEHPCVAKVYDVEFLDDRAYLVMDFVTGRDLSQLIRDGVLPPREAARLVAQIARGLAEIHRRGILHRDLKPANILLTADGQPRLVDFGLARLEDAWSLAPDEGKALIGSVLYMSPEQAAGGGSALTVASDLYSLGGTLLFLLTGKPPIAATNAEEALAAARDGKWNQAALAAATVPAPLQRICERALALDPRDRFPSAEAFARALEGFVHATPQRRLAAAAALLSLVLSIAIGAVAFTRSRAPEPAQVKSAHAASGGEVARSVAPAPSPIRGPLLNIRVWSTRSSGQARFRDLVDAVPLIAGDELAVHCDVPAGYTAELFYLTSSGQFHSLGSVSAAQRAQTLRFPAGQEEAAPLSGPATTELFLVCLHPSANRPTTVLDALAKELTANWPLTSSQTVLRLTPEGLETVQATRDFGPPQHRHDPEEIIREQLRHARQRLSGTCTYFEAIICSHIGK